MRCWSVGDAVLEEEDAVGTSDELTTDLLGLIVCQRNDEDIWSGTHTWIRHACETGTKYVNATTRRTLLALMPLCFGERLGMVTMVATPTEAGKAPSATTAAYVAMHNTTLDLSTAIHC